MNSSINTDNVSASVEVPTLDATLSTNTLIGQSSANSMSASTNANTLIGSIGNGVIVSGIRSIYVNSIEQTVIGDTAYISLSYNILTDKPTIPTKTSDLINDSGFINSGYVTTSEFTSLSNQVGIIENNITDVNNDIEEINEEIDEINETLTDKVNQTDFNNLQTQVTTNSNNISANTSNIATNTSNITTLTNITDAQSATIASMTALIEDNSDAIGTLSNLTTTDKTNLVSAINEVKSDIPEYVSDLSNDLGFITNTDYGTASKGGVIKSANGLGINASGTVYADPKTYAQYTSATTGLFIGKGTLENVITGKGLVDTTDLATKQDTLVSGTNIKTINNQSLLGSGDITITGGQATDVQINGTSITSNNTANIETNSTYDATTNKIATMNDLPVIPTIPTKTSDLTNDSGFITNTDYATASTGGVIKASNGFKVNTSGTVYAEPRTYTNYSSATDGLFIGKGTLENVLTGKGLIPVELYNGSSKTAITLSETSANFSYLEFFYCWSGGGFGYSSTKVFAPNGKVVNLTTYALNSNQLYIGSSEWNINGTSVSPIINEYWRWAANGSANRTTTAQIEIHKVIGYR